MICHVCGKAMSDNKFFCTSCGAKLDGMPQGMVNLGNPPPHPNEGKDIEEAMALHMAATDIMEKSNRILEANPNKRVSYDKAVEQFDRVIRKFGNHHNDIIKTVVAKAMFAKGLSHQKMAQYDKAIALFDDVINTWKGRREIPFAEIVIRSMLGKAECLEDTIGARAARDEYINIARIYDGEMEPTIVEVVLSACFSIAYNIAEEDSVSDAIAFIANISNKYSGSTAPSVIIGLEDLVSLQKEIEKTL